jgi:hydrogenase nickel incorporation protein HypA/HybF
MHELPVTESILEIALRHAAEAGASQVTDLYLVVGDLSSIMDDSVQFYWDMISEGTIAEGAKLHFRRIATELECLDCGKRYKPGKGELACPSCASLRIRVLSGEEFFLESISVETEGPNERSATGS